MYGVELYAVVQLAVVDRGLSPHETGRRFGIDRRTVKNMRSYSAPPGYRPAKPVRRPKLEGFTDIIDAILEADRDADVPRKQRHTAYRIFERPRDVHGFTGDDTMVVPGPEALHRRPRLDQRAVNREMLVRQQALHPRAMEDRRKEAGRNIARNSFSGAIEGRPAVRIE